MKTYPNKFLLILFSFLINYSLVEGQNVTIDFTFPDTGCVGQQVNISNNSQGATNFYWDFCSLDVTTNPTGGTLTSGVNLNIPHFIALAKDGNDYYTFTINYGNGTITRSYFGNSLLNAPVSVNIGYFLDLIVGIQIKKENGNWYGFVTNVPTGTGSLVRLEFGNSLFNIPTMVNMGNIGNLNRPHGLTIIKDSNNWYGFAANASGNTVTEFKFGNHLTNTPTGINLGNIGNLNYPVGIGILKEDSNWYALVINEGSNSITRLDFGNSLLNTPKATNLGNMSMLSMPVDIKFFKDCEGLHAFITNYESSFMTRIDFSNGIKSNISGTSLGNIGNFDTPVGLTDILNYGDTLCAIISNKDNNTLSRIYIPICNNPSIPSTNLMNPPAISYNKPGIYNISLTIDEGLPTQNTLCKTIVVSDTMGKVEITSNSPVCEGGVLNLSVDSIPGDSYTWSGPNGFSSNQRNPSITNVKVPATGTYMVKTKANGCNSPIASTNVVISSAVSINPAFYNQSQCLDSSITFTLNPASGTGPYSYQWMLNGTIISEATNSLYSKTKISKADSGKYSCTIANACNSVTGDIVSLTPVVCNRTHHTISGYVTYDNKTLTPLSSKFDSTITNVYLYNKGDTLIAKVQTDDNGFYEFVDIINGTYYISGFTKKTWGGSNPTDALIVNRKYIGLYQFKDSLLWSAGDVDSNGVLNPIDALIINRRYIGLLTKYPKAKDWKFQKIKVEMQGENLIQNLKAVCYGDVNASYAPYLIPQKKIYTPINTLGTINISPNLSPNPGPFDIPVYLNDNIELGAIGIKLLITNCKLQIIGVKSDLAGLIYKITDDGVNIAWSAVDKGYNINPDKPIIVLSAQCSVLSKSLDKSIQISSESVIADIDANIVSTDKLTVPKIIFSTQHTEFNIQNYPNPFSSITNIKYTLPEELNIKLSVYNVLGEKVKTLVNLNQQAGQYFVKFDGSILKQGIYYCKIEATNSRSTYIKTDIMMVTR